MVAAAGVVFVVALIIVTLITMKIADWIIDLRIGALRPHARLPLRRGARHPGGWRSACCSSTVAGRHQQAGVGHQRKVGSAAELDRRHTGELPFRTIPRARS